MRTYYDVEQERLRKEHYEKYMGDIHRGDIFYFSKGFTTGVEQQGGRPGVIVSNDACNNSSDFLLVCYLTTQPKASLPTHVPVMCDQKSICLCEQVHTLSKEKMQQYYRSVTKEEMAEIDKALLLTLGVDINNVLPTEYSELEAKTAKLQEEIEKQLSNNSKLVDEIQELKKQIIPVENTPEYIRICAEKDVYIKLYNDLLNKNV